MPQSPTHSAAEKVMHTPGPWTLRIWATDDAPEKLREIGLKPVPALNNDGSRYIMGGEGNDRKRIALVDCQTQFKRGTGHQAECAERDANARLIAAAPLGYELAAEIVRLANAEVMMPESIVMLAVEFLDAANGATKARAE